MLAHLVVAPVFKTGVWRVNLVAGGFDSHALPLEGGRGQRGPGPFGLFLFRPKLLVLLAGGVLAGELDGGF